MPFEVRLPPLWLILPVMVPPCLTSSEPVMSLLLHTTSGVSRVMRVLAWHAISGAVTEILSAAVMLADLMPLAVNTPLAGSYSITAPSGKLRCTASADADGAGLASEKIAGSTNAVVSSPPIDSNKTCSPTDGAHQLRVRPARLVIQGSQAVMLLPVVTRQRAFSRSMAVTIPMRTRLLSSRMMSLSCVCVFMKLRMPFRGGSRQSVSARRAVAQRTVTETGSLSPVTYQFAIEINLMWPDVILRQRWFGQMRNGTYAVSVLNLNALGQLQGHRQAVFLPRVTHIGQPAGTAAQNVGLIFRQPIEYGDDNKIRQFVAESAVTDGQC